MIVLTNQEVRIAALTAVERRIQSFDLPDKHGFTGEDAWTIDIEGAAGELAFAKRCGKYWAATVGTFKEADIGKNIQVRTVARDGLCLIVRQADRDDHVYVLMVGQAPKFRYAGCIWGDEAKALRQYVKEPNGRPPAWFIPESALHQDSRRQEAA